MLIIKSINMYKKDMDLLLDPKVKEHIQELINMLQDFYDKKIAPQNSTLGDALDYIPLFTINGALIASVLGVTYDEYLVAVDAMIKVLDLEAKPNEE